MAQAAGSEIGVAVVVVNWNGGYETIRCLDSLAATRRPPWRVYVVDNSSDDGSPTVIRAAHPEAEVLVTPRNLGYAGGFNVGRAKALADGASHLWLLNNDTTVESDALEALLEADRRLGPAVFAPKILCQVRPAELWFAGGYLDGRLKSHHIGLGELDRGQYDRIRQVEWATGCSHFYSAAVARRVGPMDERYFLYLEDVDWCLRARSAGLPVVFVPRARVYHGVSRSVERLDPRMVRYYSWRNYYLLVHLRGRWWQRARAYLDLASRFGKIGLRLLFFPSYRRDAEYHARTRGLVDLAFGRFGEGRLPPRTEPARRPAWEGAP